MVEEGLKTEISEENLNVTIQYDIATYPSDYTLSVLLDMWDKDEICIPDYQRNFVWSIKQASLLIDSFLTGLPVPPLFFYIDDENFNLVIDGQQRLLSVIFYLKEFFDVNFDSKNKTLSNLKKFKQFKLRGLTDSSPFYNKSFKELEHSDQRKLKQSVLRVINIRQIKPEEEESSSAYHIFERLNTGGTTLSPQEIRNVVYRGEFNDILKELNENVEWREILGSNKIGKRQRDIELILRVFSLVNNLLNYEKPMKNFLNKEMESHRKGDTGRVRYFSKNFIKITKIIFQEFGNKPFHLRGPLNVSALDSVMYVMIENIMTLSTNDISKKYNLLKRDEIFIESTTKNTTDFKTVLARTDVVKKYLLGE